MSNYLPQKYCIRHLVVRHLSIKNMFSFEVHTISQPCYAECQQDSFVFKKDPATIGSQVQKSLVLVINKVSEVFLQ